MSMMKHTIFLLDSLIVLPMMHVVLLAPLYNAFKAVK